MNASEYWKKNLRCLFVLLTLWFVVSFGCGILWVETLNQFKLPGTGIKLGFWFAQQGSIYAFVLIILAYVFFMNRLDAKYHKSSAEAELSSTSEN